ncbi:MAG: DUF2959 family protein [Planctomycetota bacterium]
MRLIPVLALSLASITLSGCFGPQAAVGVQQVDSLVGRVERVHLDAELSRERIQEAVDDVRALVRREFTGDVAEAYALFVEAIDKSEEQTARLRSNLKPMHQTAGEVYDAWTADLQSFSSPTLRQRSEARRDLAAERYVAVVNAMTPAVEGLEAYNKILRDHALFLSYDLNASSVKDLEPELDILRDNASALDERIDNLLRAASEFVQATAPLGKVHLTGEAATGR